MKNITLKGIPLTLHRSLKKRAKIQGRSLNREIIAILTESVSPTAIDSESFLEELEELRDSIPGRLTDKLLKKSRESGRP